MSKRSTLLLKRCSARRKLDPEEHILPLINIVFLLLVFFMVAGRLSAGDPIQLTPPKSISDLKSEKQTILVHVGEVDVFYVGDLRLSKTQLLAHLKEKITKKPMLNIRLKFDQMFNANEMLSVLSDFRGIGINKVQLLTVKRES